MSKPTFDDYVLMEAERRKRSALAHGVSTLSGLILLPPMSPRPEPPPEFWLLDPDAPPAIVNPTANVQDELREFLKQRKAR